MKIVEYNSSEDIVVEFQDEYKYIVKTRWAEFAKGKIKNVYYPNNRGIGCLGSKYSTYHNGKPIKEYQIWDAMLRRHLCTDRLAYIDIKCCKEWLIFENFYEWLHSQENFEVWKNNKGFALDKDIIKKGNKVYGPDVCCLVPQRINEMFKSNLKKVSYNKDKKKYQAKYGSKYLCYCQTQEEAFQVYKQYKEDRIKQVAKEEYEKGTISKKCYEAMIKWEVEIDD